MLPNITSTTDNNLEWETSIVQRKFFKMIKVYFLVLSPVNRTDALCSTLICTTWQKHPILFIYRELVFNCQPIPIKLGRTVSL